MKVYLAGPDVFLPNAIELGDLKKRVCADAGLTGLFPLDQELQSGREHHEGQAYEIYRANRRLIDEADCVLANMTVFRGPSTDVGTAFEMGYASAQGKPIYGYAHEAKRYAEQVVAFGFAAPGAEADSLGYGIEPFGLTDNLMLIGSLQDWDAPLFVSEALEGPPLAALPAFRTCVAFVAERLRATAKRRPGAHAPRRRA